MNKEIKRYLIDAGIKPSFKGFDYFCKAIELTIKTNRSVNSMTYYIYPALAKEFQTAPVNIERAMRGAILKSPQKGIKVREFIALASIEIKEIINE